MTDIIFDQTYSQFTLAYAKLRNEGILNRSSISTYNFSSVNLTYPSGEETFEEDLEVLSRRGNILRIEDLPKNQ